MKHLLIAASVLAMTAGVASADISFSGSSATAGIAQNGTKNGGSSDAAMKASGETDNAYHVYSSFALKVSGSGTTDSGLTFGATMSVTGGITYTLGDDKGFEYKSGSLGMPSVFVSGSFGKITFSHDNLDAYNTDVSWSGSGDVQYDGTFGGVTVGVVGDLETGDLAGMVSTTISGLTLSADYNQDSAGTDLWDASASYTMGVFTGTVAATNDNGCPACTTEETVTLAYASGGVTASAKYRTSDQTVEVAAGYTSGPMSFNVDYRNTATAKWTVTAGYDLGNGLALTAGVNYTNDVMLGATMSF